MRKTSDFKLAINAERVKLNDAVASFNNLTADLISGNAVYTEPVERAMGNRLMALRQRILGLPASLAKTLILKTREEIVLELSERMNDALAQLTDINAEELSSEAHVEDPDEPDEVN
jgi:hypothetical protein